MDKKDIYASKMDRFRQKSKKEKPAKSSDRDNKPSMFITDVKAMKENMKIKEILRTVKMNSSMRIKAPRGSKVMQNKDFNDNGNDDFFEDTASLENSESMETPSATNPDVIVNISTIINDEEIEDNVNKSVVSNNESISESNENSTPIDITTHEPPESPEGLTDSVSISQENKQEISINPDIKIDLQPPSEYSHVKTRDRKLSLDQTMLSRREGLSQSELDLNSIGKSPLERKSSFFRKKMDSFLKNTTEIFKRQSIGKSQSSIQRRGSMSVSLQSLNENSASDDVFNKELMQKHMEEYQGSVTSLQSSATAGRSNSSLSQSDRAPASPDVTSLAGSQPALVASQPLGAYDSNSIHSLNEAYIQESLLNSRAISMSSGLDSAHGQDRRKANRSNRVTWLASEGLTNYLRRVIQDEKSRETQMCHSYQDFSSVPENNLFGPKSDSKGRRLSYQRAVSGEDPVTRYQDSSLRRKALIPENYEANYELSAHLAEYTRNGVPSLQGYSITDISDTAFALFLWAEKCHHEEEAAQSAEVAVSASKNTGLLDDSRQSVIRELVYTEAAYIRHLMSIVEVFIAAAHALQDAGKLLDVDTERLFKNIPDLLNASLRFWEITISPMLAESLEKKCPSFASKVDSEGNIIFDVKVKELMLNTELMASGFSRFRELFQPYEKYVCEQTNALDYLRSLSSNTDFKTYLTWCHSHKACNRLQLSDIMVKPMQRLTKYGLILRRIIAHTDAEPERTSLIAMESFAKNYVLDLNRSIRQREELERLEQLACSIDTFEPEFKDEDIERYFRMYATLNLRAPMVNCLQGHSRSLVYEGDMRFRDNVKESDVRVFLMTDMMLICKKLSKGGMYAYKLIRPKYMIDKMISFPKYGRHSKDVQALIFVLLDEVASAYHAFALTEMPKDSNPQGTFKIWELKFREAKLTYELAVAYARNPSREVTDIEMDSSSDYAISAVSPTATKGMKQNSDEVNIEREARERVAAMLQRSIDVSTEYDYSQASMPTDSFDGDPSGTSGSRPPGLHNLRHPMKRNSTGGSSRNSRLSSFHQSRSSAASHDEPQAGPSKYNYKAGTSVEHVIPPQNPEDGVTSITVNVVSESESETVVHTQPQPPVVVLQQSSPLKLPSPSPMPSRSSSTSRNTLRVQPQNIVLALVHSLPDLTFEHYTPPRQPSPVPLSASEKLYQSHQELLLRNRLNASHHHNRHLSPNQRGTSYPPPSPTRASLKRGLAFSYSFKNPPLTKMGHVNSQSQQQAEAGPSTSQGARVETVSSVSPVPTTSTDKEDKKSKHNIINRNKGDISSSPSRKDDKGDKSDKDDKNDKSGKGDKRG